MAGTPAILPKQSQDVSRLKDTSSWGGNIGENDASCGKDDDKDEKDRVANNDDRQRQPEATSVSSLDLSGFSSIGIEIFGLH